MSPRPYRDAGPDTRGPGVTLARGRAEDAGSLAGRPG